MQAINSNSDALDQLNMRYTLSANYTERQIALLEQEAAATERAAEAKRKKLNVDKDGFTLDNNGQRMQQFVWNRASIIDYLKQAGLEDKVAEQLAKQFVQPDGSVSYEASQAQIQWGGKYSTLSEALGKMVDFYKYTDQGKAELANMNADPRKPLTSSMGGSGAGSAPLGGAGVSSGTGSNVTINLNGIATTIGLNSAADAQRLTGIFQQLEQAARRS